MPRGGSAGESRVSYAQATTRQLPLWVVARARAESGGGLGQAPRASAADKLAARAIEAARRQSDNHALMAMLRERGDLALTRGDRSAAEGRMGPDARDRPSSRSGRKAAKEKPAPEAATPSKGHCDDSAQHVDGPCAARRPVIRHTPIRLGKPSDGLRAGSGDHRDE